MTPSRKAAQALAILTADTTRLLTILSMLTDDELDALARLVNNLEASVLSEAENRPHDPAP